jgi:hypothetical protein
MHRRRVGTRRHMRELATVLARALIGLWATRRPFGRCSLASVQVVLNGQAFGQQHVLRVCLDTPIGDGREALLSDAAAVHQRSHRDQHTIGEDCKTGTQPQITSWQTGPDCISQQADRVHSCGIGVSSAVRLATAQPSDPNCRAALMTRDKSVGAQLRQQGWSARRNPLVQRLDQHNNLVSAKPRNLGGGESSLRGVVSNRPSQIMGPSAHRTRCTPSSAFCCKRSVPM